MRQSVVGLIDLLNRIPPAGSIDEAWNQISGAVTELDLKTDKGVPWTIPSVTSPSSKTYGRTGIALRLTYHQVYINQSGAFRVVEAQDKYVPILTKRAANGAEFQEVGDFHMPF